MKALLKLQARWLLPFVFILAAAAPVQAKIPIVAAENFYGDIARQIGGSDVDVASILSNPNQDPHLFEASPATARQIAGARIAIANGADYDPWMATLLRSAGSKQLVAITLADLVGKKPGDNPHLWYDPANVTALARKLANELESVDHAHAASYKSRESAFEASLKPLNDKIAVMRSAYAGRAVAASEPVFGYMAERIGLDMLEKRFQLAVMNGTEPAASDVAQFEQDLRGRKVAAMIINSQASDPSVTRLVDIAKQAQVPIISVSETEPARMTYQTWMIAQLTALDHALSTKR